MSEKRQANIVVKHIKSEYGANPEFLWPDRYPGYAVFRHGDNKKWFVKLKILASRRDNGASYALGDRFP